MITSINQSPYTTNFTARCPEIRDAEWVCRTINHTFPHFSSSKQQVRLINLLKQNRSNINYEKTPQNLTDVYEILESYKPKDKTSKLAKQFSIEYLAPLPGSANELPLSLPLLFLAKPAIPPIAIWQ